MELTSDPARTGTKPIPTKNKREDLLRLSEQMEASFLAEMLKAAGIGKPRTQFGGGAGEDHFAGFLTNEYAAEIAKNGGLGLKEAIYNSLTKGMKK